MTENGKVMMSVESVAATLDVSVSTVWRRSREKSTPIGEPEFPKPAKVRGVGTRWFFDEVVNYVEWFRKQRISTSYFVG